MMKLYFLPGSVCAQKALITAGFKRASLETISMTRDQLAEPGYRALNSKGVVPTLIDDYGNVIVESSTIMRFIDEAFSGPALQPQTPYLRSIMSNWMKAMDEELFPAIGCFTMATLLRPAFQGLPDAELRQRMERIAGPAVGALRFDAIRNGIDSQAVTGAIATWQHWFAIMEYQLEGRPWLAGDDISLGDIALIPAFLRLADLGLEPWWCASLPHVQRWWRAVQNESAMGSFMTEFPNPMSAGFLEAGSALRDRIFGAGVVTV